MKFDWKKLIVPSVHLAEAAFGNGQGNAKLSFVLNIAQTALMAAAMAGALPASAATDLTPIVNQINEVVADENDNGNLDKIKKLTPSNVIK